MKDWGCLGQRDDGLLQIKALNVHGAKNFESLTRH